jgi:hypothetical protein
VDITTILIIAGLGLVTILVAAYMLNRAWGDFPGRVGPTQRGPSPVPPPSSLAGAPAQRDDRGEDAEASLPAGVPEGGLVPITHPLVLRAVENALERGGSPYATYFIRHGERVFLAAYRIADPAERERVTRVFEGLNSEGLTGVNFDDVIGALRRLAG